jgi:hypothetical protein
MTSFRSFAVVALTAALFGCGKNNPPQNQAANPGIIGGSQNESAPPGEQPGATSQPSETTDPLAAVPRNCSELGQLVCARFAACSPYDLEWQYGTQQECAGMISAACAYYEAKAKSIDMQACSDAMNAPQCQATLVSGGIPKVCRTPRGGKVGGAACGSDSDCQSLLCSKKGECGTCTPRDGRGASCVTSRDCEPGFLCNQGTCDVALAPGSACDANAPRCPGTIYCVNGQCKPLGGEGSSCDLVQGCDEAHGIHCVNSICAATTLRGEGESCSTAVEAQCRGGLFCSGGAQRTCAVAAAAGEDCTTRLCKKPLVCLSGACSYEELNTCAGL